jgi:hypothetical protein
MNDPLGILRQLYPDARVTSARRDPNSALGRANPHSYHNIGQAFDIAPMHGVSFGDYVNNLKSNGVNVVEALDEASNPKPWTTGPNWHIAYGASQVAPPQRKPRTLADAALPGVIHGYGGGTWNPDGSQATPVSLGDTQPMQQAPRTLADLQTPQVAPKHGLFGKGGDGWKILGILGDSYSEANGRQGNYIPELQKQREDDRTLAFDREKWNAQLEAHRQEALAKAAEPPQFIQNLQAYTSMPDEAKRQYLSYLDATNPIAVSGPQGTQRVPRSLGPKPGTVEDGFVFLGGDPADQSNWRPQ